MDGRKTADVSTALVSTALRARGAWRAERPLRARIREDGLKKGGENGRTASWLGHICRSGRHERSRHKSSAGSAPRSNHSYFIVREEDTTSGYPYGPKVPGGRRRRPDDLQTGGPAKTGADPDRGCGDRLLAPRKEQAQDPPARGDYGQGRLTSKQGGWGREQLCLEAAQKELDA